jgi:hypothetical protein
VSTVVRAKPKRAAASAAKTARKSRAPAAE